MTTVPQKLRSLAGSHLPSQGPLHSALDWLNAKTGVDKAYLAAGGVAVFLLYLVFGHASQLLCNGLGFLYPAYTSIKALESSTKEDDTRWLTYWVVFAAFCVIEFFSDVLVSWLPLYWLSKCIFLIWCMAPIEKNGAKVIYNKVILPYFNKYHKTVDNFVSDAGMKAKNVVEDVMDRAMDVAKNNKEKILEVALESKKAVMDKISTNANETEISQDFEGDIKKEN